MTATKPTPTAPRTPTGERTLEETGWTVVRHYEPDDAACLRALRILMGLPKDGRKAS